MSHPQQALEKGARCRPTPADHLWQPEVRRTVVIDSLVEHLTVDFGHNYSRVAFSSSYPFVLGTYQVQRGFSGDPNHFFFSEATVE